MSKYLSNYGTPLDSEPWRSAFIKAGAVAPTNGEPSYSALSRMTGLHASTISRTIGGVSKPDPNTAVTIAKGLGLDFLQVAKWLGIAAETNNWEPPFEVQYLTVAQTRAIDRIIHEFAAANRKNSNSQPANEG